jgi:hypothetical protein
VVSAGVRDVQYRPVWAEIADGAHLASRGNTHVHVQSETLPLEQCLIRESAVHAQRVHPLVKRQLMVFVEQRSLVVAILTITEHGAIPTEVSHSLPKIEPSPKQSESNRVTVAVLKMINRRNEREKTKIIIKKKRKEEKKR